MLQQSVPKLVFNMELTSAHISKLDEMSTLLSISDDLTIAFVHCNEPVLRHALDNEIRQRIGNEIFIYDIRMDINSTNLLQNLRDAVHSDLYNAQKKANKKIAFFVFGLDDAIEKKNPKGGSEALVQLNMMREKFLNINHTIILWINSASLSLILKEAQDFFSWRTTVFEFGLERKEQIKMVADFGESDLRFLDKEELEERWDYYNRLLKEFKEKGFEDASKFSDWNYNLGMIKLLIGYADEALEYFEESLGFLEKSGDKTKTSNIFGVFGMAYSHLGQVEKAIEYYEKALVISREIGDQQGEGAYLEYLGLAYSDMGHVEKAIEFYEKALVIAKKIGGRRGEGARLGNLGNAYSDKGMVEKAIEFYEKTLMVSRDIGDQRGEGAHLGNLGNAYFNLGQIEKAIEYHEKALVITREIGSRRNEGAHLGNLGLAYSYLGQVEKAIEYHKQALVIAKEIKDTRLINFCEENLKSIRS
ncbi:MAG: tetratricopeptide repeat protein [Methanosarcinaceae archaeon]|nr:tetratricopeptide repeat protein [Methanosarcinaceae archaeon]